MSDKKLRLAAMFCSLALFGNLASADSEVINNQIAAQQFATTINGFTSGEHVVIGDEIIIHSSISDDGSNGKNGKVLHLANGLSLTYGDIVALGDFYGTPGSAISFGKTLVERNNLFMEAFNQFYAQSSNTKELQLLIDVTHEEVQLVDEALKQGKSVAELYQKIASDHNRRYNCITGGGCSGKWWLNQGRYLKLAKTDYDHFNNNSILAYQVGHDLAIELAMIAHSSGDTQLLEKAYAMNAFASHFLSDRFSAGHIRTPRYELDQHATPSFFGSLLAHYMHDEEGQYSLHVHNARGDRWKAYGDKHYFDVNNGKHLKMIKDAMQLSADEIFEAYKTGKRPESKVIDVIPYPDAVDDEVGEDIAPMFYWDKEKKVLYRRASLPGPHEFNYTTEWWAWSTYIELNAIYGSPNALAVSI